MFSPSLLKLVVLFAETFMEALKKKCRRIRKSTFSAAVETFIQTVIVSISIFHLMVTLTYLQIRGFFSTSSLFRSTPVHGLCLPIASFFELGSLRDGQ